MQNRSDRIAAVLSAAFAASVLEVSDDSAAHAGHAGARPEGETHYSVLLVSAAFFDRSRVERERLVHAALKAEFGSGLHALSLRLRAPGEPQG